MYYCRGDIVSYEVHGFPSMHAYPLERGEQRILKGYYIVETHAIVNGEERDLDYKIMMELISSDFMHPQNEGIYLLQIVRGKNNFSFTTLKDRPDIIIGSSLDGR